MSDPRRGHGRVRGVGAGGRGLGVFVRGAGGVENVVFSDILIRTRLLTGHWWGKAEPLLVELAEAAAPFRDLSSWWKWKTQAIA